MRRIGHWTPGYVWARLVEIADHRRFPEDPWLTRSGIELLKSYLNMTDKGLETGSGRSTEWLSVRVGQLISLEHSRDWYERVQRRLRDRKAGNVDYHLIETQDGEEDANQGYVKYVASLDDESLDFALIDGVFRDFCCLHAMKKLRRGGLLIIDNANWYLPSESRSPNSRRHGEAAGSETWTQVEEELEGWRRIWTSSGVTDTAFFFRPWQ